MGKSLAEILADAASAELEFSGPEGLKFKVSDLKGTLESQLATEKAALQARIRETEGAAKEAAAILKNLQQADAELKKQIVKPDPTKQEADWTQDPLYTPLVPIINEMKKTVSQSLAEAQNARKQLTDISSFYALERMRHEYESAPESFRKTKTFDQAVQEAIANNEVVAYGQGESTIRMPSLSRRIHEGTEADRIAAATAKAVADAKTEWEKNQRQVQVNTKPGRFNVRQSDEKPPINKIEELTAEKVAADPEIAAIMQGGTVQ